MNVLALLRDRFVPALAALGVEGTEIPNLLGMLLPSQDSKFGDYQANFAMPLGKKLGKPPREIAQQLVAAVELSDICEPPQVAGPGFINLRLKDGWLVEQLSAAAQDIDRLGVAPAEIEAESVTGRATLYVVLTRATQRMVTVSTPR